MRARERDLKEFLKARLAARPRRAVDQPGLTCAAILIPLRFRDGGWHVVVTLRTETVNHHKGQISFPGGSCEPADLDRLATALRETREEIGVPPAAVEVLGVLDDFTTITGFGVTPYVGVIESTATYVLNEGEVSEVIEVPLSFLLDPAHLRTAELEHEGRVHEVLFWDYGPYTIWGATARMLKNLLDLLA